MSTNRFSQNVLDYSTPASWFAVGKSSSLKMGEHRSIQFLNQQWILFRGTNGQLGLISRYCSHMGADLNAGCVAEKQMVCPLHKWRYNRDGSCEADIPSMKAMEAGLSSFEVQEWAGIIFVFPAKVAVYELPRDLVHKSATFSSTNKINFPFNWFLPALNTFDLSHFGPVHNREFIEKPQISSIDKNHLEIRFKARVLTRRLQDRFMKVLGFDTVDVSCDCWGASLLIMRNYKTRVGAVIGVEPRGDSNSNLYITAFNIAKENEAPVGKALRIKLEIGRIATTAYLKSDIPVLKGMLPREGVLIPGKDDGVLQFWRFFHQLPKVDVSNEN